MDNEFHNIHNEFPHEVQEYCDASGKTGKKIIKIPKAMLGGLSLVSAVGVSVVIILSIVLTQVLTSPLAIGAYAAEICVHVQNISDDAQCHYTLCLGDDPQSIVQEGPLSEAEQILHLQNLQPDTDYTLFYYLTQDAQTSFLDSFRFRTRVSGVSKPSVTPSTGPNIQVSVPEAAQSQVISAAAILSDDLLQGYQLQTVHSFRNVPDNNYTLSILHNNTTISTYTAEYDENSKTVTVQYLCPVLAPGETAESIVKLTCSDGGTAQSTLTAKAPSVSSVTLEAAVSPDGTVDYTVAGNFIAPTHGSVTLEIQLQPFEDGPLQTFSLQPQDGHFTQTANHKFNTPGTAQTASVKIDLLWSLADNAPPSTTAQHSFRLAALPTVSFSNISYTAQGFDYTATFSFPDMDGTTPQRLELIRDEKATADDSVIITDSVQVLTAANGLALNENGMVTASISTLNTNTPVYNSAYHDWTAILTYLDHAGNEKKAEVSQYICPVTPSFNGTQTTFRRDGNTAIIEFMMFIYIEKIPYPGNVSLSSLSAGEWTTNVRSSKLVGNIYQIQGTLEGYSSQPPSFNAYLSWSADKTGGTIYSGCGSMQFYESSGYLMEMAHKFDDAGTPIGYEHTSEEHRFYDTNYVKSEYQTVYIRVTLADGTKVTIPEGQTEALGGKIRVGWNENESTIVVVDQTDIDVGDQTLVEYVTESQRSEPELNGLVERNISQSIHVVEYIQV